MTTKSSNRIHKLIIKTNWGQIKDQEGIIYRLFLFLWFYRHTLMAKLLTHVLKTREVNFLVYWFDYNIRYTLAIWYSLKANKWMLFELKSNISGKPISLQFQILASDLESDSFAGREARTRTWRSCCWRAIRSTWSSPEVEPADTASHNARKTS